MPILPHVSGADVQRALERLGLQKIRQSGSHVVMKRELKGCVVPMHSDVQIGTLAGLPRQAEVAPDELVAVLSPLAIPFALSNSAQAQRIGITADPLQIFDDASMPSKEFRVEALSPVACGLLCV